MMCSHPASNRYFVLCEKVANALLKGFKRVAATFSKDFACGSSISGQVTSSNVH
jgi:hypothetical protein